MMATLTFSKFIKISDIFCVKYLLAQFIEKISKETKHYVDSKQTNKKSTRINLKSSILFFSNIDGLCQSFVSFSDKTNKILWRILPLTLREKCPNTEFFLVRIQENRDQKKFCLDTFHAVSSIKVKENVLSLKKVKA